MQHFTFSIPEKLPILNDYCNLSNEENIQNTSGAVTDNPLRSEQYNVNSLLKSWLGWEYFRNQLEFE
jgi:hypothetical protein